MSVRPAVRTRLGLPPMEPKPINANPLGLLIVLDKPGRRRPSIGLKQADGNRSDDNEASAFSYSSDDDDSDDGIWSEDRRAYLSELNDEYLLAMSLDDEHRFLFEPCRKMKPMAADPKRKQSVGKRRNVYKRTKNRDENKREAKEGRPRNTSAPTDPRPSKHFWSPSSSWSAIGRFFGRLKHGHHRDDDDPLRKLSLQTTSTVDTEDSNESISETRVRCNSYDDPEAFLKQVVTELRTGELGHSSDVSHLKVVSRNADDQQFTVTSTGRESLAVCKEYFSRLTCYDSMPHLSQAVAVDTRTPIEEVFNILCRHRTVGVVLWNASSNAQDIPIRRLCDIGLLVHLFWPYFTDAPSSRSVSEYLRRPVIDFFTSPAGEGDETLNHAFDGGVPANISVTEAARIFWHETQTRIPVQQEQRSSQHRRRFGRLLLPLVDELTGDVVHALSAKDLLRFLSKELCKFDLTSAYDRNTISDLSPPLPEEDTDERRLFSDYTLRQAASMLIESQSSALPVFKRAGHAKASYKTLLSIADVVDLVAKSGYCSDTILSKSLDELLVDRQKQDVPTFDTRTSISKVLRALASSNSDHGSWDSLLPVAVIMDDKGDFAGFLQADNLLTTVLSLDEPEGQDGSDIVIRKSGHERHDSGVGEDDLQFYDESLDSAL